VYDEPNFLFMFLTLTKSKVQVRYPSTQLRLQLCT
jgi:hypothetical protein